MNDLSLLTVNWNQQPCVELLLKSYVKHHYTGEPLKLMLFDNGSDDGSKVWLRENEIPFFDFDSNMGHEIAINSLFEEIRTKYALLVDTDVEFKDNVFCYINCLQINVASAGEMIDKNYINSTKIKDRVSPWFLLWDHDTISKAGIKTFRDELCQDWTYDVASWFTEQVYKKGFVNYNIPRLSRHQDQDENLVSMIYEKYDHIGKVSWDVLNKHQDRIGEVFKRRAYIQERLKEYHNIDLKGKFIYG